MKRLPLLIASCFLFNACSPPPADVDIATDRRPALHAVQDRELRQLMDRMNGLLLERFMTEQEIDIERGKFARQISEASATLAATAKNLVDKLPGLGLNPNEQTAFRNLAHRLEQQALTLQKLVENRAFNTVSGALRDMKSTCLACHTLFRQS